MKYKVGDKVRIRKDLKAEENYYMEKGGYVDSVVEDMLLFREKTVTITDCCDAFYKIDLDDGVWGWTDEMFEGLAEEAQPVNKQEEIPYINAAEAREIYDEHHSLDALRKLVYSKIKKFAPCKTSESIIINSYPKSVVDLMEKELIFKGFFVTLYNYHLIVIAW